MEEKSSLTFENYYSYRGEFIKLTERTPNLTEWDNFLKKQGVVQQEFREDVVYNEFPNLSYYMKLKDIENQLIQLDNNYIVVRADQIKNEG